MKITYALLVPALVGAAAIERRQAFAANGGAAILGSLLTAKPMKAFKIEAIRPTRPNAKRVRIIYGPYKLKGANSTEKLGNSKSMDAGGTSYLSLVDVDFPKDITALEASSRVVDENFKHVTIEQGIYDHHTVFLNVAPSSSPYACKGAKAKSVPLSVFMAGAAEDGHVVFATPSSNIKSGFYLAEKRRLVNMIDIVNYNKEDRNVYTESEIEYLPGKQPGYLNTAVATIDPGTCGGQGGADVHPPVGQKTFQVNGTGIVVAKNGYIHGLRGHLHDGGVDIRLMINDKLVCTSKALYGGPGHVGKSADGKAWESISATTECPGPIKVNKGDRVFIQGNYDVGLHPAREEGHMGADMMPGTKAEQMALFQTFFSGSD